MGRKSRSKRQSVAKQKRSAELERPSQGTLPFRDIQSGTIMTAEYFAGPFPHPDLMERYEEVVPGLPQVMVQTYKNQNEHRLSMENRALNHNIIQSYIGQFSAFVVTMFALYLSYLLVATGFDVGGFVLAIGALATLAGVFFIGRKRQEKERQAKDER